MVLADDLHTQARVAAIQGFDAKRSKLSGYFHMLGSLLRMVVQDFGAPRDLYDLTALFKKDWRALAKIIAALEAIMRRLLLMLAAKDETPLAPVKTRAPERRAAPAPDAHAPDAFHPLRPNSLPARLTYAPPLPAHRTTRRRRTKPSPDKIYVGVFSLASRLEALIRIYEDPQAAASRLRRRLARHPLKHQLCARMMIEPSGLNKEHPHLLSALKAMEPETVAANNVLGRPSG